MGTRTQQKSFANKDDHYSITPQNRDERGVRNAECSGPKATPDREFEGPSKRMNTAGKVLTKKIVADGGMLDLLVGPDKHVWATDGRALYRIKEILQSLTYDFRSALRASLRY